MPLLRQSGEYRLLTDVIPSLMPRLVICSLICIQTIQHSSRMFLPFYGLYIRICTRSNFAFIHFRDHRSRTPRAKGNRSKDRRHLAIWHPVISGQIIWWNQHPTQSNPVVKFSTCPASAHIRVQPNQNAQSPFRSYKLFALRDSASSQV